MGDGVALAVDAREDERQVLVGLLDGDAPEAFEEARFDGGAAACEGFEDDAAGGPVNVSAPSPATNKELSKTLGRVLNRPAFAPVPALAVKTLYGEMAHIVITGQRMLPARLEELGYDFAQPELEPALRSATGEG